MKMKKLALLLLVLVFSMTACSSGQDSVDFNYTDLDVLNTSLNLIYNFQSIDEATKAVVNNTEGQEVYQTGISNFENAENECGDFKGFITNDNAVISLNEIASRANETGSLEDVLIELSSSVEEEGATVRATLDVAYEERDAQISIVYVSDKANTTADQSGNINVPFKLSEVTISPNYTFGEKMAKAAMNTLMGMGSVFVILIFIALIIGQFERLSKAITTVADACGSFVNNIKNGKNKNTEETKEVKEVVPAAPVAVPASNDLMNDSQLVAVITAAIMAAQNEAGNPGSDGLVVRSIRKAKR